MRALARIAEIIEGVDQRCMACDGPVTPTLQEMRQSEISEIYKLAKRDASLSAAKTDLDGVIETNLRAIAIRCEEGDKKSNWLPIIHRLALEAMVALQSTPVTQPESKP